MLQSRGCVYLILDFIQNPAIRIPFRNHSLVGSPECPDVFHHAVPRHSIAILDQLLSDIRSHAHTLVTCPNHKRKDHMTTWKKKTCCLITELVCRRVMSFFQAYQWNLPFYAHFDHRPHNPPSAPPLEMRLSGLKPSCSTPSSRPIAAPALAGGSLRRANIFRPSRKPALVVPRVGGIADDKLHKQHLTPHLLLILGWTCPFCTLFLPKKRHGQGTYRSQAEVLWP